MEQLSAANSGFALDLFRTLSEDSPSANIFFSPLSISSALAMVFLGTRGSTAAQVSKALHFDSVEKLHSRFQSLNADINKYGAPYILKLANRLYGEITYNFLPEFLASTQRMYGAELASVDFQGASEDVRKVINEWVKEQREGSLAMEQLSAANSGFALDLFHTLSEDSPSANIFFSPLSISSALAMVFLGTRGSTAAQVSKALRFDAVEELHLRFQSLNADINKHGAPCILKLANRLFGEKTYNFLPEFLASTQQMYSTELASVDFQGASEDARKVINEWVKGQTEGKIPELLAAGLIDNMTRLVLVNAIYFKGTWQDEFKKEKTRDAPFRLNKKDTKTVKMMYRKEKLPFRHIENLKCSVLELPYKGGELSMVILLPSDIEDESTGLKKIEQQLTLEKLHEWTKRENMYSQTDVHVHLPKFKLEETYSLNSHLVRMGVKDLFLRGKADLSGMTRTKDLFVSKIVHKSFVEVNEEGTEAAAATGPVFRYCCYIPDEKFIADHPFIFMIRHNSSGSILFLGRLTSP